MKNLKNHLFLVLLLQNLFFFACKKESRTSPGQLDMASTNKSDDLVTTPQGPMPKSQVHLIENGYHLELRGNHVLKILTASGEMKEDFGAVKELSSPQTGGSNSTKTASGFKKLSSSLIQPDGSKWKTYAEWGAGTSPIGTFSTNFTVPAIPTSSSGQLLYIGNGIESAQYTVSTPNLAIEPVLQFGTNGVFGSTTSWTIANWCSWNGGAAYSTPATVTVGTGLQGVITLTSYTGSTYNYTCAFNGSSAVSLNVTQGNSSNAAGVAIPNIPKLSWAFESFQGYSVTAANQYPSTIPVKMTKISLQTGTPGSFTYPSLTWTPISTSAATLGENTSIISNDNEVATSSVGEVDFFSTCSTATYPSSEIYHVGTAITPLSPTTANGTPTSYSISPNITTNTGLTFNTTTGVISGTPTKATVLTTYTITAHGAGGCSNMSTINIGTYLAFTVYNRSSMGLSISFNDNVGTQQGHGVVDAGTNQIFYLPPGPYSRVITNNSGSGMYYIYESFVSGPESGRVLNGYTFIGATAPTISTIDNSLTVTND